MCRLRLLTNPADRAAALAGEPFRAPMARFSLCPGVGRGVRHDRSTLERARRQQPVIAVTEYANVSNRLDRRAVSPRAIFWTLCVPVIAVIEMVAIVMLSAAVGRIYNALVYGDVETGMAPYALFGLFVALTFALLSSARGHFSFMVFVSDNLADRTLFCWSAAFLLAVASFFLLKAGAEISRAATVIYFFSGLVVVLALREGMRRASLYGVRQGWLAARRIMVVGRSDDIGAFLSRAWPPTHGLAVVGRAITHTARGIGNELEETIERARALRPDGIVLVFPWSDPPGIVRWLDALMTVPATIHLAPPPEILRLRRQLVGSDRLLTDLVVMRAPLTRGDQFIKRLFDVVVAGTALVVLAPLLLLIALLVRLDSRGPALFWQQRQGFNMGTFWICKFRTMHVADGRPAFSQAVPNDPRVTRFGRLLRRWSLDELPQLYNVLRGDMSIVGPRPHVLALNTFSTRIAQYARRINMKPGITGWAQVNGLRGETDTEEKMRARVEHDLYYIDNWSLWFDVKIMLLTVLSPRAARNAY